MIEVSCFRCQVTKTIVDQTAANCADCGGPLVPVAPTPTGSQQHSFRQSTIDASNPASPEHHKQSDVLPVSSFDIANSETKQHRSAYCPSCGSSAVVNQTEANSDRGEFQLACPNCHSCWILKLAAAHHETEPPQFSQRGDRQANATHSGRSPDSSTAARNPSQRLSVLTERQKEVMDLVVSGKANKQTAHILGLSEKTVERHRANLMRRLGVKNLVDLVRLHLLTTGQLDNSSAPAFPSADARPQQPLQMPNRNLNE